MTWCLKVVSVHVIEISKFLRMWFFSQGAMKVSEVKQVEEIVNKMAEKNGEVYDMNVSLAVAKAIQGLRAVFDEVGVFVHW